MSAYIYIKQLLSTALRSIKGLFDLVGQAQQPQQTD